MDDFVIRPVRAQDGEAVTDLVFGVLREYGLQPAPETTDADLRDVVGFYERRGGTFDVLEVGDGLVGTVALLPVEGRRWELRKMYLAKAYRGRGLGTLLLEHALEKAKLVGAAEVILETAFVLKEAVALYAKYGFERLDGYPVAGRCDQAMIKYL